MLKFGSNQKINVSRTFKGEQYEAHILSSVNKTIIISRPKIDLGDNKFRYIDYLNQNNMLYGQYIYEGIEYYFKTTVIKSNFTPFPHIILKYPDDKHIKYRRLRKYKRFKCVLPLRISSTIGESEIEHEDVFAVDISLSGIGIACREKLPKEFVCSFDIIKSKIKLSCVIQVVKPNNFKNFHFYGCNITKNDNEKAFREYIDILSILSTE